MIPHGGGGPGMGPIGVVKYLKEFLPSNPIINSGEYNLQFFPLGASLVLTISYAY